MNVNIEQSVSNCYKQIFHQDGEEMPLTNKVRKTDLTV